MTFFTPRSRRYWLVSLFFLLLFALVACLYILRDNLLDARQFKRHAEIIADDIWALNETGVRAYLQLVLTTSHCRDLAISIPGNDAFLHLHGPPLSGLSKLLYRGKLIWSKSISQDIVYRGEHIGTLDADKYVRVAYPLFNILIFFLFMLLTTLFVVQLSFNRKKLEKQVAERTRHLLTSERRFEDLVNLLPEMVLETDLNGIILYANQTASTRLLGDNLVGQNFLNCITGDGQLVAEQQFQAALGGNRTGLREYNALDLNGRFIPVLVRAAPIFTDDKIIGSLIVLVDITDQRKMKEQLSSDQKMKAIGLMAGGVAHDLNNILSGIISYPELLLMDIEENSPMRRPLEAIHRSGLDAAEVVSDLLMAARGVPTDRVIVAANELISNYLGSVDFQQLQAKYPQVSVKTEFSLELRNISCSPIHLRKCLMNLIINGMEAIEGQGNVTIATANSALDALPPGTRADLAHGEYTRIIIDDSGTGIAPEDLPQIFEPFYTRKAMGRSGTGLGLALVWNITRDHGGSVHVASSPSGTTFELWFPSVDRKTTPVTDKPDHRAYRGQRERILVIDDEPRQRHIAQALLTALNYRVASVASGEEAVAYLQNHEIDLLVLDMILAPGWNGRQSYAEILQIRPGMKAIIASGFAEDEEVEKTLAMGAAAFVKKPYTFGQIGSALYKALHR
jgi:two-component system, cell cycle sensor histidine kinase and response regulator CckA